MVYPVGVTTYWCYFSWIIANNFAGVYCILTKYTTFLCTKFQGKQITCFHFMVNFILWQKEELKTKKLSQFLKVYISWKRLEQFSWNLECGVLTMESISTAKIVWFRASSMKLRIHENCAIVLPVSILTGMARWVLGLHDILPCVLIGETTHSTSKESIMVPHIPLINYHLESEVSITLIRQSVTQPAVRIGNCLKSTSVATMNNTDGAACSSYCLKVKYPLRFFVNPLHSGMKQNLWKESL